MEKQNLPARIAPEEQLVPGCSSIAIRTIKTFDKSLLVLPGDYISWMEANDRLAFKNECAASAYVAA
jgi:hypothetical protein